MVQNTVESESQNYMFPVGNGLEKHKIILLDTQLWK